MNIKEIIDAERQVLFSGVTRSSVMRTHNAALDRIEAAVLTYIKRLEKQVSTLEKAFIFEGKKFEERIKELESALERLMDDYQYSVGYDESYDEAKAVLGGEK